MRSNAARPTGPLLRTLSSKSTLQVFVGLAFFASWLGSPASAIPTTIGFNISGTVPSPYQEAGFDFNATNFPGTTTLGFLGPFVNGFAGTTASPSIVTMTSPTGDMWDVLSLDVSGANSSSDPQTLNFTGTQVDGTVLTASFGTVGGTAIETVTFSGFTNLTQFTFETFFTTFDNLVVDNIQPVPEPGTAVLLAIGIAGLAFRGGIPKR